jgi:hypothetical protein
MAKLKNWKVDTIQLISHKPQTTKNNSTAMNIANKTLFPM